MRGDFALEIRTITTFQYATLVGIGLIGSGEENAQRFFTCTLRTPMSRIVASEAVKERSYFYQMHCLFPIVNTVARAT